jgi:hypothetical protein
VWKYVTNVPDYFVQDFHAINDISFAGREEVASEIVKPIERQELDYSW